MFNTFFPRHAVQGGKKWPLLLTILSGYSGSSTVAANFDSKDMVLSASGSCLFHLAISGQMVSRSWSCEFAATGILQFLRVRQEPQDQPALECRFADAMT